MAKFYKILDNTSHPKWNFWKMVFLRNERTINRVPILRWWYLCFLEIFFGTELLESFTNTASNSGCPEDQDEYSKFGEPNQLNFHIPTGIFTDMFRSQLRQLLYYKFYLQYCLILPVCEIRTNHESKVIDVSLTRFRFRKALLYQVIGIRRVYLGGALALNLTVDFIVYCVSNNIHYALISAVVIEFLRRFSRL